MSILQVLRSLAGGGQKTVPSNFTIALLCMNPCVKSSALRVQTARCYTAARVCVGVHARVRVWGEKCLCACVRARACVGVGVWGCGWW